MQESVATALDTARATLDELQRRCCDPGRSPRLEALASMLAGIRDASGRPGGAAPEVVTMLDGARALVAELQVECCTPNRLPLYATLLEQLDVVRRRLVPVH